MISGITLKNWIEETITPGDTFESYVNKMRKESEWGTGFEIMICCHMFKIVVVVYKKSSKPDLFARVDIMGATKKAGKRDEKQFIGLLFDATSGCEHYDVMRFRKTDTKKQSDDQQIDGQ